MAAILIKMTAILIKCPEIINISVKIYIDNVKKY